MVNEFDVWTPRVTWPLFFVTAGAGWFATFVRPFSIPLLPPSRGGVWRAGELAVRHEPAVFAAITLISLAACAASLRGALRPTGRHLTHALVSTSLAIVAWVWAVGHSIPATDWSFLDLDHGTQPLSVVMTAAQPRTTLLLGALASFLTVVFAFAAHLRASTPRTSVAQGVVLVAWCGLAIQALRVWWVI